MSIDYSLYLVTDSSPEILGTRSLLDTIDAAIRGGVTIVQYRNKHGSTSDLIREAKQIHAITQKYGVPLIINDRADVAVAVGAEGVHIGQDDIDVETARKMLACIPNAIVGVTASNVDEALAAANGKATYLGLGTVFATSTKPDSKSIIGIAGLRDILSEMWEDGCEIPCVCIGGINTTNVQRVLYETTTENNKLEGVAIVSAIMGSTEPELAAKELKSLIKAPPPFVSPVRGSTELSTASITGDVIGLVGAVVSQKPLCHNMTNTVVQTLSANIAIAIGGSPIMSSNGAEAADLAKLGGSLVINMGTSTPENIQNQIAATTAYNAVGRPVLFDPVGGGATAVRRQAVKSLMAGGYFDVIKGNEGEIKTVAGRFWAVQQRGVDSGASTLSLNQKAMIVEELAKRERCIVVMSGETDVVSDGKRTIYCRNGHEYMGLVTGSGCAMGTVIAAFLAVSKEDKLVTTIAAILLYNIAAEVAAEQEHVKGPGSFLPTWVDQLYRLSKDCVDGKGDWTSRAKLDFRRVTT